MKTAFSQLLSCYISAIETSLLPMLAGVGLSSVFLDILRRDNRRTAGLIKIFNNELVYSGSVIE